MVLSQDVIAMTFTSDVSTTLNIDGMLMDSATIASVLQEAIVRKHVQELILRNVTIDDVVAKAAEDLFTSCNNYCNVNSKSANSNSTDATATAATATNTDDDCGGTSNGSDDSSQQQQRRIFSKIEIIHCTGLISRLIKACIGHVQQLQFTGSVPIAHNPRYSLDVASLECLGRALQDHPDLTVLVLRGTRLNMQGLQAFCVGLADSTSLHTLQMSHCALEEPDHVTILARALQQNQQLTTYCLSHCKFGTSAPHISLSERENDFFPTLLESLVDHPKLQSLNIHGMYCNPQATQALSDLLRQSPCLWHLGLKNNIRYPEDKLHFANLIGSLEHNKKLSYLQISGNNLDSDDMIQLSQILSTSNTTALRALSLTANAIEDRGLSAFADHLAEMNVLRYLDVQRNPITQISKSQMIAALRDNVELERLDMDGTWDATKAYYLSLNRGGRRLLQSSNDCPMSVWPLVLARVNRLPFAGRNQASAHLNVLYCLLLQGPVLFQPRRRNGYKRRSEDVINTVEEEKKAEETTGETKLSNKVKRARPSSDED